MSLLPIPRFFGPALILAAASTGPARAAEPAEAGARGGRAEAPAATPDREYLLQPQDILRIFIFQHDDLNKQMEAVRISDTHTISLPLVNSIDLRGRTARQAEEVIRAAYDRDYLVNVVGQVNNAGRVLFPQEKGLTIVEAIALAGGQTRLADLKKVRLTRKTADGETVVEEIDVDALMKRGGRDAVQLQRDDVLFVPERAF
jgi:polysaccharide export outer membrane protein